MGDAQDFAEELDALIDDYDDIEAPTLEAMLQERAQDMRKMADGEAIDYDDVSGWQG